MKEKTREELLNEIHDLKSQLDKVTNENAWHKARIKEMQFGMEAIFNASRGATGTIQNVLDLFNVTT